MFCFCKYTATTKIYTVLTHSCPTRRSSDRIARSQDVAVQEFFRAGPAGIRTTKAFSQSCRYDELDTDREKGCIRSKANAYSQDGGLAVLYGNLAARGCIVQPAGVDKSILKLTGTAVVLESQDADVKAILGGKGKDGAGGGTPS